jgi:hypothetical protein
VFPRNDLNSASFFAGISAQDRCAEPHSPGPRWINMNKDSGKFGLVVGGIVALAAAIFIFSGGELGGKKSIEGDQDLPPVTTTR